MLSDLHLIRPEWLWAIPAVIAVTLLLARRKLGLGAWQKVVDPALAPHVLSRSANRRGDGRWWLAGIGGVIAVIALAGPAWQRIDQPVFRSDQALVVALDLSRSMDAQDVAPSRLMRARLKILDLLERRGGGQTALVVYSSNAFTVTPLTTDTDTIAALVNSLSTDIMPSRGSYPIAAITKSRTLLEQAGAVVGEILLISDGGYSPAAERVAGDLAGTGYALSVLGVGSKEGAPIPRITGGFVTDQRGSMAVPKLEESGLRKLAASGGGRYARLTTDNSDLDYLLSGEVGERSASGDSLATDQWREEGPWLVLLLLPLAAMAFRRGWVMLVALAILPMAEPAQASFWDDLWSTKDQQAKKQLEAGDAEGAAELFENPEWRAVAQYRASAYEDSAGGFAESAELRNLYNLGNALARQGEFESAIDAYEEVLEIDPEYPDAAYNRDLLKQAQEQQQQQQEGEQQQSSDNQGEGQQSDQGSESQEQSSDNQSESDSQSQDEGQPSEEEMSQEDLEAMQEELQRAAEEARKQQEEMMAQMTEEELEQLRRDQEQQQAMEQWLRRIPNDPGGLLRRKFRYQYQKSGKDQDGNNTWPDDEVQPW
jgi:Ca-activated chloride channel family protein